MSKRATRHDRDKENAARRIARAARQRSRVANRPMVAPVWGNMDGNREANLAQTPDTLLFEEWAASNGYDVVTRQYR